MSSHSGISLDVASIIALVLEATLYGISVVMFGQTMKSLWEYNNSKSNRIMFPAAIGFLILCTMHVINNAIRLVDALVYHRQTEEGPVVQLENVTEISYILKNAIYTCQTLLGDFVVIYRVYVVYDSFWIIILPILLWCGVGTTAISMLVQFGQMRNSESLANVFALSKWVTAFFSLSLCANMISTIMLAVQIYRIERRVAHIRVTNNGGVLPIARIVADSGLLYSASIVTALFCFVATSNSQYIVLDMIMPIISISYYLIMIRLAEERKKRTTTSSRSQNSQQGPSNSALRMQPLQIQLSTVTDVATDAADKFERFGGSGRV